jgi:crossover junction endodeoxyribonuclease RuvC
VVRTIIIGIDPGTARCGFGVIEEDGGNMRMIDCGLIETPSGTPDAERLTAIYTRLSDLVSDHKPAAIAVEQLFYGNNSRTAMSVGQARGVILLAAAMNNIHIAEYTPVQVKQAVSGYGAADKQQVKAMVQTLLQLKELRGHDDISDALAVAICHAFSRRMAGKIGSIG